jgi:hypothetical protein
MIEEKGDHITIKAAMGDRKGQLIPYGVAENLTCIIEDGRAVFWFKDSKITKRFVTLAKAIEEKDASSKTFYIERLQKAKTEYPGMQKEEIKDRMLKTFKEWGMKE